MVQWIRPWILSHKVQGSNPLFMGVVPLGKALYPRCLAPQRELKGSMTHMRALQISMKFLLQVTSDMRIL